MTARTTHELNETRAAESAIAADPVDFERYGTIYNPKGLPPAVTGPGAYPFRNRIGDPEFPAEPHRYHLYVSYACPFAHRALIVRALKGLEDVVTVSVVDPIRDGRGWAFRDVPGGTLDTAGNGFRFLTEAYEASAPRNYGRVSVPVLWDKKARRIVSNYFPNITLDLAALDPWARHAVDLYPEELRTEIDALSEIISDGLNHGVYHAGFATTQEAYEAGYRKVFATLDALEERLVAGGPYLLGERLTETDVRAWVTLIRFDTVYHGHFKVNRNRLADFPALWDYTRRLYALPAFHSTTNLDHIRRHYYGTQLHINPSGIVPLGPELEVSSDSIRGRDPEV